MNTTNLQSMHTRHVLSPWGIQGLSAPVIVKAHECHLFDSEGRKYLDFASGLVAVNLGHGHPAVIDALQTQARNFCYAAPSFFTAPRAELAKELSNLSPWTGEGCRVFFTTSGAEANDDAVRIARHVTGRRKVLSAYRSFHGASGISLTLSGEDRRWVSEPGDPSVCRFFAPYPFRSPFHAETPEQETVRAIEHIERILLHENPRQVAAILIEPVVGGNGVIIYPDGYLAGLRALTEKHGILLIFDEVMTGFGRVGAPFASTRFGVTPDLITFAKGVTSAYVPLGGVMVRENLASTFDSRALPCGHTYSGHPLCVATGLATVKAYQSDHLFERALLVESWIRRGLHKIAAQHGVVGEVRGLGALFALELVKGRSSRAPLVPWQGSEGLGIVKTLYADLLRQGVAMTGRFNCVVLAPPLTVQEEDVEYALDALETSLGALAARI